MIVVSVEQDGVNREVRIPIVSHDTTVQTGDISVQTNTFYTKCQPSAMQNYTFPTTPNIGDKVGFRISGVSNTVVPTLVAMIDDITNIDINNDGDFVFVYTGSQWTAALGGVSYV